LSGFSITRPPSGDRGINLVVFETRLAQHQIMGALGLCRLIDQAHAARARHQLLGARILKQSHVRRKQAKARGCLLPVGAENRILRPGRGNGQAMHHVAAGRIKFPSLRPHQEIHHAARRIGLEDRRLQPERGQLAPGHVIQNQFKSDIRVAVTPFQHRKCLAGDRDAIPDEQRQAFGEEARALLARPGGIPRIERRQYHQGGKQQQRRGQGRGHQYPKGLGQAMVNCAPRLT
jgi:hypothetical protein